MGDIAGAGRGVVGGAGVLCGWCCMVLVVSGIVKKFESFYIFPHCVGWCYFNRCFGGAFIVVCIGFIRVLVIRR